LREVEPCQQQALHILSRVLNGEGQISRSFRCRAVCNVGDRLDETQLSAWDSPAICHRKTTESRSLLGERRYAAALKVGIRLEPGQRFGFHNFCHSLATFLVSRGKDVKTIRELLRHAKVTTTLDLYSQSIDAAKLEAQEDIALAIRSAAAEIRNEPDCLVCSC
jgi:integrase